MGDQPESRLAIAVVLLTLQALLIVSQYLVSVQGHRRRNFLPGPAFLESLILLFPIFVAVLGVILIAVMFTSKDPENCKAKIDELCKDDERCKIDGVCKIDGLCKIDDDIGGRGIRFAAWAQLGVLLFLALIGIFHTKTTGIKEVAASLTITHLALVTALLVKLNDLEAADAILGSMILDSQNNALSIPLMTKATLGARWQVWTIVSCQAFGLAVLGVLVHKFHQNHFKVCCKKVLSIAQSSYQALVDTYAFHEAEKSGQGSFAKF
ncbi:hypothetical protein GCG54_00009527 [Colletotrichum gloeosporioides]|uniref:Uncharacterized protein n=1 Tax=Colletotrichum gloeosporioides TaxID=474922 RepID=A0A8H4FGF9_COLGL|nr:uncharacterized protein GCG54_00009527 [Colletotrichum gloeosporioides]KAF3800856.1 hypothetical protein GCG54_00009527 [Colletotrichum gloeosporioides]